MRRVEGEGVELAVRDEGDGPAVLLLHGFPDSSRVWRHQVPALADAGFRVVVPDLRGFGQSDKPEGVEHYAITRSLADIAAALDALGIGRAHVVGHDVGAALAWIMAALAPERVDRLAALSVGHPNALRPASVEQREKFWYQLLFQFEGVAEELLERDGWHFFREVVAPYADVDEAVVELSRPGALTAALNWYRANSSPARELSPPRQFPAVAAPVLGLWSSGDRFLLEAQMLRSGDFVTGPWRYERVEGAGHWLQLDAPRRVNELLLEFLRA